MGSNDTREQQPSSPCSWYWDGNKYINNRPPHSQLLHSTSSDLDNKMKMILELIENDGDTFAARAEMYYQKKPQLIRILQEYHQSYRALADKYDHLKSEYSMKLALSSSPLNSVTKSSKPLISSHQDLAKENIDHQDNSSSTNMHSAEESIDGSESHSSIFDQVQSPQNVTSIGSDNIIKSTDNEERDMNLRKQQDELITRNVEKRESMIGLMSNDSADGESSSKSSGKRNQTRDHQSKRKLRGFLCLK